MQTTLSPVAHVQTEAAEDRPVKARLERQANGTFAAGAIRWVQTPRSIAWTGRTRLRFAKISAAQRLVDERVSCLPPRNAAFRAAWRNGHAAATTGGNLFRRPLERIATVDAYRP